MNMDTQSLQSIINFILTAADDVLINKYPENQYQDEELEEELSITAESKTEYETDEN